MKTKKAAAKRIFVTSGGTLKKRRTFRSHNLAKKSASRKRLLVKKFDVKKPDQKRMRKLLGIGG